MSATGEHISTNTKRDSHASLGLEEAYILGYNVQRLREQANMGVTMLARVVGMSRPTIYKIEKGKSNPQLSFIKKLADALDTTVVELLSEPPNRSSKLPFPIWFEEEKARK